MGIMMKSDDVKGLIEGSFPGIVIRVPRERRVMVHIPLERLIEMLRFLHDQGVTHISTISVVDRIGEKMFEILYHLYWENNEITVRVEIPRENPVVPTVTPVLPGALTYEREIQDMFGIRVENIPNPRRILLSDDWPEGEYPLRKDYAAK
jgi:NADH:ubiquinone oxidoreductase subunit C